MAFILKPYEVRVSGYAPIRYEATSAGKARAKAWRDYGECRDVSFRDFMRISSVRKIPPPERFGEPVIIAGMRAYVCLPHIGQYIRFARDDSDIVLYSHPADVKPVNAPEPETIASKQETTL